MRSLPRRAILPAQCNTEAESSCPTVWAGTLRLGHYPPKCHVPRLAKGLRIHRPDLPPNLFLSAGWQTESSEKRRCQVKDGLEQYQAADAGPTPKVSPSSPKSHGKGCDGANSPYSASCEMSFSWSFKKSSKPGELPKWGSKCSM
ncbi:hypothetical protein FZEAL_1833 [Fusarium zealandicum]|uniref:Uncharacterized protein n=1 Tax=Fusarium zealandicum TaxID=1053134 RepID=A0A8H4XNE3_9HYPO|nr:hypothetical protein FZEAL_1833 [Fusarium zealandicum]